jgi:outer membrane protein TolC
VIAPAARRRPWWALPALAGLVCASGLAAAQPPGSDAPALEIGSAAETDTAAIRRAIEAVRASRPADVAPIGRTLSLDEAIEISLRHNLDLQIATLDRDAFEREVPAAKAFFHPTPGLNALATDTRIDGALDVPDDPNDPIVEQPGSDKNDSQTGQGFVRQELPTGGVVTLGVDLLRESGDDFAGEDAWEGGAEVALRQPLMRGGRIYVATRPIQDAEFNLGIFESRLRAQILFVVSQVKQAYYNTIVADRLIQVSQQAIERDQRLIEASEALFRAGRASQRDIVSAQIRLSDDQSDLASRHAGMDVAQLELRNVLGLPIGEYLRPADSTVPFRPVEIRTNEWVGRALANRPEIQEVVYRLDQSALAVRVAGNFVLPKLDLVGLFRRHDFGTASNDVWGFPSQSWAAGVEFEIPFGNVAARERLQAAQIVYKRTLRELERQRRLIELEVRGEEVSLRENLGVLEAQTAKVEQARAKLEIAQVRYARGLADNFDVTDAQEDLVDAESDLLGAVVDYANGLARLEARIAGPL